MSYKNASILVISDAHLPYAHKDLVPFLSAIKKKYKITKAINIGDELDFHALSYHESDPDLYSAGDELEQAKKTLKQLYKIFPEMDLLESNHGSMVFRRQKTSGIPLSAFKSYNEILEAPRKWRWHHELILNLPNNQKCYFHHGKTSRPLALAQSVGMSAVAGHHHQQFSINYWQSPGGTFWQMQVGCLVDKKSMAFAYGRNFAKEPVIGCGVIIEGVPKLVPLIEDKKGNWIGRII